MRESAQAEAADADDFRVKLVGYLEAVTQGLVIDLVTVTSYDIAGGRVVVPQRVEPERPTRPHASVSETAVLPRSRQGELVAGVEAFRQRIVSAPVDHRPVLETFVTWAERISEAGHAELSTYFGK